MMDSWLRSLSFSKVLVFIFAENIVIFLASALVSELLCWFFRSRREGPSRQISRNEMRLATFCVFNNSIITLLGFYLWQINVIRLMPHTSLLKDILDFFILFFIMDFAMYVFHRLAHLKFIYPIVHKTHHVFIEVRPLTLFSVLILYSPTWGAMMFYLIINVIFGSLGHLSIEPFPNRWMKVPILNHLTTRTFHSLHHESIDVNYGFYTTIWDKLGRSISANYTESFREATRVNKRK